MVDFEQVNAGWVYTRKQLHIETILKKNNWRHNLAAAWSIKSIIALKYFPLPSIQLYIKHISKQLQLENSTTTKVVVNLPLPHPITNIMVRPTFTNRIKRLKRFLAKICWCQQIYCLTILNNFFSTICNIKVLFPTGLRSVRIRSYYGPYSVRMLENTDHNNSEYGQLTRSVRFSRVK